MSSEVGTAADSGVVVRAVSEEDRASWRALYRGYRDFYKVPHSDEAIDTVWSWLHDEGHETRGLVALVDGVPLGLSPTTAPSRGPSRRRTVSFSTTSSPLQTLAAAASAARCSTDSPRSRATRAQLWCAGSLPGTMRPRSASTTVSPRRPRG